MRIFALQILKISYFKIRTLKNSHFKCEFYISEKFALKVRNFPIFRRKIRTLSTNSIFRKISHLKCEIFLFFRRKIRTLSAKFFISEKKSRFKIRTLSAIFFLEFALKIRTSENGEKKAWWTPRVRESQGIRDYF